MVKHSFKEIEMAENILETRRQLGWQIVNVDGFSIHGDHDDPFHLMSFEILVGDAVETAKNWALMNAGYSVTPVFEGDIEEPGYVPFLSLPHKKSQPSSDLSLRP
jgi:hypothetical protein